MKRHIKRSRDLSYIAGIMQAAGPGVSLQDQIVQLRILNLALLHELGLLDAYAPEPAELQAAIQKAAALHNRPGGHA